MSSFLRGVPVRFERLGGFTLGVGVAATTVLGCGTYKSEYSPLSFGSDAGSDAVPDGHMTMSLNTPGGYTGPTSCEQAKLTRSYIGCDYWPTVTTNPVWSVFDFAAVVANEQTTTAVVHVTGPKGFDEEVKVGAGTTEKIYLPWVPALKGPDCDQCGIPPAFTESVTAPASAYHLVSSLPVTVSQFNALEYQPLGGPYGKDWSACPGSAEKCHFEGGLVASIGCYSYTNDASLLIPSTAMTGNYRVAGEHAAAGLEGGYFAITAVENDTTVTVSVAKTGSVIGGGTVPATPAGGTMKLTMQAGDVIEVMGDATTSASDLSGSLVQASKPVQVIAGIQCAEQPNGYAACDHLESTVLPAETLGSEYVVTVPTSPGGVPIGHVVRFYGNVDGTTLTYSPVQPAGCPSTLDAGQVVQCKDIVAATFVVRASHEFAVSSFQVGGSVIQKELKTDSPDGDPSMSPMVAVEQYLESYIFLAPSDYDESFLDIVSPPGTELTLDGKNVTTKHGAINKEWDLWRIPLATTKNGSHVLLASNPVGVQVLGYGAYTSYQYPAGLDLTEISAPPLK